MIAGINQLVDLQQAIVQQVDLPILAEKKCTLNVLRTDKIHATISGNKWFKLKYNLLQAMKLQKSTIVTAGGAYSNHLVATAYACRHLQLRCVGIVRGEKPGVLSATLQECIELEMELQFVDRELYRDKKMFPGMDDLNTDYFFIEEGGCNALGVRGSSEIAELTAFHKYSHICCAAGTGTMMAGLINSSADHQQVSGISALKLAAGNSIEEFISKFTNNRKNYTLHYDYHFGGYARKTAELIDFMNAFYKQTGIATDFVYTAKLFYGVLDLLSKDHFPQGSNLLVIHSGGIQGNRSLPKNTLFF